MADSNIRETSNRQENVGLLASGGLVNLAGSASQAVFAFLLLFVVGRGLGAGGAGAFLEAIALFNILATTATLGVSTGLIYTVSRLRARGRTQDISRAYVVGFAPLLGLSFAAALVVILNAEQLGRTLGDATHAADIGRYLSIMAWFIPVAALLLATLGATRGYELMWPTVLLEKIVKLGLQVGLVFLAIQVGLSEGALITAWLVPILIALAIGVWWLWRLYQGDSIPPGSEPTDYRRMFREFWTFTLPRSFASIFRTVVLWLDVLLVGALVSPEAAGIYAVSTRLLQFGLAIALAVGQVSQPMISRLMAREERSETRDVYEIATSWQILLTWPQYIAIALFAVPLLALFGSEFTEGATVVGILAVSAMVGTAAGPVDMVLLMAGKSMWSFWNTALSLAVNLALNLYLIPRIGITGAAIAWAAARIVGNLVPLAQVAFSLKLHPFGRRWMTAATAAVTMYLGLGMAFRALDDRSLTSALLYVAVASLIYALVLYRTRGTLELSTAGAALMHKFRGRREEGRTDPVMSPSADTGLDT